MAEEAGSDSPAAVKMANGRKMADRPHHLTLFASIAALMISIAGLVISWISYQSSSRNAAANLRLTEEVQSASLESETKLESRLADFEQPSFHSKSIKLLISWTLKNAGNTAATRVQSKWVASLNDTSNSQIRQIGEPNRFGYKMDPHQRQDLPIVLVLTPEEFRRFRQEKAQLEITGEVKYKDIFNREHALNWTALLKGDGILTVRQY